MLHFGWTRGLANRQSLDAWHHEVIDGPNHDALCVRTALENETPCLEQHVSSLTKADLTSKQHPFACLIRTNGTVVNLHWIREDLHPYQRGQATHAREDLTIQARDDIRLLEDRRRQSRMPRCKAQEVCAMERRDGDQAAPAGEEEKRSLSEE